MAQDQKKGSVRVGSCRIAVAMDDAFHFYYQDNLEMLEAAGAEIVAFSPLSDKALPPNTAGVYLGGGYPEVYAAQLEANDKMRSSIKRFARSGGPVYAECGGLMYLSSSIRTREGERHRMAGILPLRTAMFDKLSALRYVEVTALENSILTGPGTVFRGHEFHYSKLEEVPGDGSKVRLIYDVRGRKTEHRMREGFSMGNVLASYIHLHFGSNPELAENLVKSCLSWSSGN
jgi:cobyrinic acid a,c-diamide synthase